MSKSAEEIALKKSLHVKHPIGLKLSIIISFILVFSLVSITMLVSYFVRNDEQITAEDNNFTINARSANAVQSEFETVQNNVFLMLDMIADEERDGKQAQDTASLFFKRNKSILAIIEGGTSLHNGDSYFINSDYFAENDIEPSLVHDFISNHKGAMEISETGKSNLINAASLFSLPVIALCCSHAANQAVVILFSTESISDSFGSSSLNHSSMINNSGDLLVDSDFHKVQQGTNLLQSPLVQDMKHNSSSTNKQILFTDENGVKQFGAYQKISLGECCVLTTIPYDRVFEAVDNTTRRNIYLTIAVLCISIIFVFFFSKSISVPIKGLTLAAADIERGNYDVKLNPKHHDELALLTKSFVKMSNGLAERQRLMDTFSKFTNKAVAEKAMRGELTLGGETKDATIFFSDIRSFTALSEKLTPEEVISFLNEYTTRMVDCVIKTGGVVDKYIGDAIMAVWGAPVTSGTATQDALNTVRAALFMRASLILFNQERVAQGKPAIRIGCGINSGPVVAGQVGSSQKMEYTVIGDAVNFASRTESLNKPLGTDILITENTWNLIKEHVLVEEMPSVTVKGKTGLCRMFAVINMPEATDIPSAGPDGPKTMAQIRTKLGIPTPDYAKVNLDEEEHKYKIQGK